MIRRKMIQLDNRTGRFNGSCFDSVYTRIKTDQSVVNIKQKLNGDMSEDGFKNKRII